MEPPAPIATRSLIAIDTTGRAFTTHLGFYQLQLPTPTHPIDG